MTVSLRHVRTVVLPGTGSDDDYTRRAFDAPLRQVGAVPVMPRPRPSALLDGYWEALDSAASGGPIAVGGVSIGAAVAVAWALRHPDRTVAVLAALPAWTGDPACSPAAGSALATAAQLRRDGLAATTAQMAAASPRWLADELTRSWRGQWPALPEAMETAAGYVAPTRAELAGLRAPLAVAAAADDPIHPRAVGTEWVAAVDRGALRVLTLDEIGADPAVLGRACLAALAEAGSAR
ncbi:alpha/beta hydrolase [Mycolicibacillus parakoreensis]|uniref:Alpha/beta hydrolase n=1 Tax=Mycolicibacillus parakoreensis TaxID=1069221 RepID=A0ABY3TV17_9MYCO|nr:alpha/beta hydrolase [Mycolicibacillus parakoreensis]MCV7317226.1 alpha/beta hydrolase [Mycolicibacillus parakoreensis]ULN51562.1 alpha/beta hydrolase [Mycolicibacillus parakoreensis]HLR99701.1 alpha/beta hydrolase [Mycolicibacillus parakoreensis]